MLGQITEVIFACYTLKCLQEAEDFMLNNIHLYSSAEITCVYTMLHVRNNILKKDNIVKKLIYKDE